jgi:hypothetical protein
MQSLIQGYPYGDPEERPCFAYDMLDVRARLFSDIAVPISSSLVIHVNQITKA